MPRAFTAKWVETVQPSPEGKRLEVPDGGLPGLYLVIQPTGAKAWALRYRFGSKPKKMTIGAFPIFGLADARDEARRALQDLERGIDPAEAKQAAQRAAEAAARQAEDDERDKVKNIVGQFISRHAKAKTKRGDDVEAIFRRDVLPTWGERRIQTIGKRDVIDLLDAIVDSGRPVLANRVRAHLNTCFAWAVGRDIIDKNPVDGIKPPAEETPRDRVLTDAELVLLWRACDAIGPPFGPLYRFLLLTGQRLREAAEMPVNELQGDEWHLPAKRSKNGEAHVVPLSPQALAALAAAPRIVGDKRGPQWVFSTTGDTPVSGFTRAKSRLDKAMDDLANDGKVMGDPERVTIPPFVIHDLRRTVATGLANMGFPPHVVEAVLNHKSGTRRGVAGIYNRSRYADECRAALDAWARRIEGLVTRKDAGVIAISTHRSYAK